MKISDKVASEMLILSI